MAQKLSPFVDSFGTRHASYFVDTKSGVLYFRKRLDGKELKFSCETDNITLAKRFASRELKKRINQKNRRVIPALGPELDRFLELRSKEALAGDTFKNIKNAVKKLKPFWENKLPSEIRRDTWLEFCEWYKIEYSGEQVENCLKYFRNFCYYLAEPRKDRGPLISVVPKLSDPDAKAVRIKRKSKKSRVFTKAEIKTLLSVCGERDQLIILLMYLMALRVNEACGLRKEYLDLDHAPPLYRFREGMNKAGLDGCDSIPRLLIPRLRHFIDLSDGPYVFPQKGNSDKPIKSQMVRWESIRSKAKLGWHWTPHTFRHSCLTALFNDPKVPDSYVIKTKRISLAEALNTYIHVTTDKLDAFRDAMEFEL